MKHKICFVETYLLSFVFFASFFATFSTYSFAQTPVISKRTMEKVKSIHKTATRCAPVLKELFCYAGDDRTDGHKNLFECFKDSSYDGDPLHEEALLFVAKLYDSGEPIAEIRKKYDKKFEHLYPFSEEPSPAYLRYKSHKTP